MFFITTDALIILPRVLPKFYRFQQETNLQFFPELILSNKKIWGLAVKGTVKLIVFAGCWVMNAYVLEIHSIAANSQEEKSVRKMVKILSLSQ